MELAYDDIRATVLTRNHLGDEVQGINASLELIRRAISIRDVGRRSRPYVSACCTKAARRASVGGEGWQLSPFGR